MWESKEQLLPNALSFVALGMHAVCLDARGHGRRWESWQRAGIDGLRAIGAARFMNLAARLALETADDVVAVCSWLRRRKETADHVSLWGVLLGANAILAAAPGVQPASLAAAYGHADWNGMWTASWSFFHGNRTPPPPSWSPRVRTLIARLDPLNHTERFFPAPLLAIHGADETPTVDGMRALIRGLRPYYASNRGRLKFHLNAGGHRFDAASSDLMLRWISRWAAGG
jgi:hypothetical protein